MVRPLIRVAGRCSPGIAILIAVAVMSGCQHSGDTSPAATSIDLPSDDQLRAELDEVLDFTQQRYMRSDTNAAWQILHGILAYGRDLKIEHQGELVGALDWLLAGGNVKGFGLIPGPRGLDTAMAPGSKTGQGHEDQWLAVLSQCDLPWDQPIRVGSENYTMGDMVTQAQWDVRDGMECSWTIIALSQYLSEDDTWTARDGSEWSLERVVAMEAAENVDSSACGGTHRLIGMKMALDRHVKRGGELYGGWALADEKIKKAIEDARRYQQPDGGLSASYFRRASSSHDIAVQISTGGHVLEFLSLALDDEEIESPWVTRAALRLCAAFRVTQSRNLECGSLYHAAHGLKLYRERRFGPRKTSDSSDPPRDAQDESLAQRAAAGKDGL